MRASLFPHPLLLGGGHFDTESMVRVCVLHIHRSGLNHIYQYVVVVVVFTLKTVLTDRYPIPFSFLLFKAKKRISVVTS